MLSSTGVAGVNSDTFSHSVARSNELLSCCKTAWKIQQQQNALSQPADQPPPSRPTFQLADPRGKPPPSLMILEEGLTLLRAMEYGLKQLQVLVKRRGHTNDPTAEISALVQQLEQDTKELTDFCQQVLNTRRRSKQAKKHWEFVVQWFQQVANQYSNQIKACLKIRGDVLTEQAQQRKKLMVDPKSKNGLSNRRRPGSATATPLFDSPLFTANTSGGRGAGPSSQQANRVYPSAPPSFDRPTTNVGQGTSMAPSSATSSFYYGGAGGSTTNGGYCGYGGMPMNNGGTGMRQRKGETVASTITSSVPIDYQYQHEEEEEKIHQQIQKRKQQRATQQRLNEAQQAETMLGELGQLFGKMSTLISQQGEVLEKIEDDVEAAHTDILAGQEELTNLYSLKKGNRPLIIKTFLVLNFLIIFMRAYKGK